MSLKHTPQELVTALNLRPQVKVVTRQLTRVRPDNYDHQAYINKLIMRPVAFNQVIIEPMWDVYYAVRFSVRSGTVVAITDGLYVTYNSFFLNREDKSLIPKATDITTLSELIYRSTAPYAPRANFKVSGKPPGYHEKRRADLDSIAYFRKQDMERNNGMHA